MKIVKSIKESGLLLKGLSETLENESKEQERWFLGMLLCTLGASLLRNLSPVKIVIKVGDGVIRTGEGEIQKNFQNEPKLNGIC